MPESLVWWGGCSWSVGTYERWRALPWCVRVRVRPDGFPRGIGHLFPVDRWRFDRLSACAYAEPIEEFPSDQMEALRDALYDFRDGGGSAERVVEAVMGIAAALDSGGRR